MQHILYIVTQVSCVTVAQSCIRPIFSIQPTLSLSNLPLGIWQVDYSEKNWSLYSDCWTYSTLPVKQLCDCCTFVTILAHARVRVKTSECSLHCAYIKCKKPKLWLKQNCVESKLNLAETWSSQLLSDIGTGYARWHACKWNLIPINTYSTFIEIFNLEQMKKQPLENQIMALFIKFWCIFKHFLENIVTLIYTSGSWMV